MFRQNTDLINQFRSTQTINLLYWCKSTDISTDMLLFQHQTTTDWVYVDFNSLMLSQSLKASFKKRIMYQLYFKRLIICILYVMGILFINILFQETHVNLTHYDSSSLPETVHQRATNCCCWRNVRSLFIKMWNGLKDKRPSPNWYKFEVCDFSLKRNLRLIHLLYRDFTVWHPAELSGRN